MAMECLSRVTPRGGSESCGGRQPTARPQSMEEVEQTIELIDGRIEARLERFEKQLEVNLGKKFEARLTQWIATQSALNNSQFNEFTSKLPGAGGRDSQKFRSALVEAIEDLRTEVDMKIRDELQKTDRQVPKSFVVPEKVMNIDPRYANESERRGVTNITADSASVTIIETRALEDKVASLEKLMRDMQAGTPSTPRKAMEKGNSLSTMTTVDAEVVLQMGTMGTPPPKAPSAFHGAAHHRLAQVEDAHSGLQQKCQDLAINHTELSDKIKKLHSMIESNLDLDMGKLTHQKSGVASFNFELDCTYDREFEESIWDSLNFWFLPGIGSGYTIFITVGFLATILSQAIFLWAILKGGTSSSAFLSDQYPSLSEIAKWRLNSGHNIEMMDALDGVTLVDRVCRQDGSLPYSGTYQTLRSDLSSYLSDNIGVYLCGATIFTWVCLIVQNVNPVVSGVISTVLIDSHAASAIGQATEKYPHHQFRIVTFTLLRKIMMIAMHLLRGGVVSITGVTGALWLANTKNLSNLILNASALGLILTVDQLTYAIFLPKKLQSLILQAQPLTLPDRTFGGIIYTLTTVLGVIAFCVLILVLNVVPDNNTLGEKQAKLCGGNRLFVYSRHGPTGTLYAASTQERAGALKKWYSDDIVAMMKTSEIDDLSSSTVALTPHPGKITLVHSETMQAYTEAYMAYFPFCMDTDVDDNQMVTVRQLTSSSASASCADMKQFCDSPTITLIRLLCPITCGCADARSGLVYRVKSEGCPVDICRKTEPYLKKLDNDQCGDESPHALKADPAWQRFFENLLKFQWMGKLPAVTAIANNMLENGCGGIISARTGSLHIDFCEDTEASASRPGMGSLRAFCPQICKCVSHLIWERNDCPTKCYNGTVTTRGVMAAANTP